MFDTGPKSAHLERVLLTLTMSADTDAKDITIHYDGGSITMAVGTAKMVFGEGSSVLNPDPEEETISVKSHNRTRVIGGGTTSVSAFTYNLKQWPRSTSSNAKGGSVVYIRFTDSDGWWTTRVSGSIADLMEFLNEQQDVTVELKTQRGTKYGPLYWDSAA